MSEVRLNFLNWRPDLEDFMNDGLTVATNVVHDAEGYKEVPLHSAGSFATTGGLVSVSSIVAKPVGAQSDTIAAWISNNTLNIGINGVTMTSPTTGYPLSFATAGSNQFITAFDVCELNGVAFFVVQAEQNQAAPATVATLRHVGYATLTAV